MPRYRSYGLTEEDNTPPYKKILPDRIKKLIDLYHKNHIEYEWTTEDENEQIFEYRKTLRPNTYTFNIESIYRVRDPRDKSKEYYFYQKKGTVLNDRDDPEYTNSLTYGYAIEPVHELRWNPKTNRKEPYKIRDDPVYFWKWDKKEVEKLLDKSETPCFNLYVGTANTKGNPENSANNVMIIKHREDFLNGDMDDLMLLNKAGIITPEMSTLAMIDKAKSRFEEEALKKIAQVSNITSRPQIQTQGQTETQQSQA